VAKAKPVKYKTAGGKVRFKCYLEAYGFETKQGFKTKEEAQDYIDWAIDQSRHGVTKHSLKTPTMQTICDDFIRYQSQRVMLGEIGDGDLENKERICIQLSSMEIDGELIKNIPVGDISVGDVRTKLVPQMFCNGVKEWIDQKNYEWHFDFENGQCPWNTAIHRKKVLHMLFKHAVLMGHIAINPIDNMDFPAKKDGVEGGFKIDRISEEIVQKVIQCAAMIENKRQGNLPDSGGIKWVAAIRTAAMSGIRAGEQRALQWSDIDFQKRTISITKSVKKNYKIGPPKTAKSRREITVAPSLITTLREWKLAQTLVEAKNDLVFPNRSGGILEHGLLRRKLRQACRHAKVGVFRWHDLRHFYASTLIFNPKFDQTQLARLMGHGSLAFTYKVYAHWFASVEQTEQLSEIMEEAFANL
jgi:integrase